MSGIWRHTKPLMASQWLLNVISHQHLQKSTRIFEKSVKNIKKPKKHQKDTKKASKRHQKGTKNRSIEIAMKTTTLLLHPATTHKKNCVTKSLTNRIETWKNGDGKIDRRLEIKSELTHKAQNTENNLHNGVMDS